MLLSFLQLLSVPIIQFPLWEADFLRSQQMEMMQVYAAQLIPYKVRDFKTDSSLQKFVSPQESMETPTYRPADLVPIAWNKALQVPSTEYTIRKIALPDLLAMAQDFQNTFKTPMRIVSSYRAYSYQKQLFAWYIHKYWSWYATTISAKPWHSEHQLGLAIDIFDASSAQDFKTHYGSYAERMKVNAYKYWWTQSYQKGKEVDWYVVEPWHYRYVGKEIAGYLHREWITFSEFVKKAKNLQTTVNTNKPANKLLKTSENTHNYCY